MAKQHPTLDEALLRDEKKRIHAQRVIEFAARMKQAQAQIDPPPGVYIAFNGAPIKGLPCNGERLLERQRLEALGAESVGFTDTPWTRVQCEWWWLPDGTVKPLLWLEDRDTPVYRDGPDGIEEHSLSDEEQAEDRARERVVYREWLARHPDWKP